MVEILFACGHTVAIAEGRPPICACGCRTRQRVLAPAPRFTGACSGPLATTTPVAPIAMPLVPTKG